MKSFGTKYWDKSENKNPRNLLIYGDFLILAERESASQLLKTIT